jgi:protein TonB
MEAKKNPKYDVYRYQTLFVNIGLCISLVLVILAFEWRYYDNGSEVDLKTTNEQFEELIDIPQTQQPPPPPKQVIQQPQIIEVPDEEEIIEDIEIDLDVEMTEETVIEEVIISEQPEEEVAEEIFVIVEDPTHPEGGLKAFYEYVGNRLKYPAQARRMGIEGKVFVQFIVDKQGNITDVTVAKGIGAGCDEEAIRVLRGLDSNGKRYKDFPKWVPGKQRGVAVKQRLILPITFKLAS